MNKQRRKRIAIIIKRIPALERLIDEIRSDIESIKDEEETCMNNLEDSNLCESEKYEKIESAVENLSDAIDCLDDLSIENLVNYLENAAE